MCANACKKAQPVGSLDEKTKDSGTFSISDAVFILVRMYLCGYVACSARTPAQHSWMCCANELNIVGPCSDDRETLEMLAPVGFEVLTSFKLHPTTSNKSQQHTTWCANSSSQTRIRETDKVLRCLKHSASLISTQSVLRRNSDNIV